MPIFRILSVLFFVLATMAALPSVKAETPDRAAVEGIIRDYLMAHPEVIVEAVTNMQEREKAEHARKGKEALTRSRDRLQGDGEALVLGNPRGDRVLVEFLDYACGYCKAAEQEVHSLIQSDPRLRLVVIQFPILGPGSVVAAKAALASQKQERFPAFHQALMAHRGGLNEDVVMRVARSAGLDTDLLKRDMASPSLRAKIDANLALAKDLGINGTPAFVAGGELVPGMVDADALRKLLVQGGKS